MYFERDLVIARKAQEVADELRSRASSETFQQSMMHPNYFAHVPIQYQWPYPLNTASTFYPGPYHQHSPHSQSPYSSPRYDSPHSFLSQYRQRNMPQQQQHNIFL